MSLRSLNAKIILNKLLPFLIIGCVSLTSLTWFRGNHLIGAGDHYKAIDYYSYLKDQWFSWDDRFNTGSTDYSLHQHLPASLVYLPLGYLGFSRLFMEKVWFYLSMFLPASFMYLFLRRFLPKKTPKALAIAGSLFYIFNPLLILHPFATTLSKFPAYLTLPLFVFLMVSIFEERNWRKKVTQSFIFVLASCLLSSSFTNIAETAPVFIVLGTLFIYELTQSRDKIKHILLFGLIVFFSLLVNFWWIYGSFYNQFLIRNKFVKNMGDFIPQTFIHGTLRLLGSWALHSSYRGVPYFTFAPFYYSRAGIFWTYLTTLFVFSSLFFVVLTPNFLKQSERRRLLLVIFLALVGIFLAKGDSGPWGVWYANVLDKFPLLRMFREAYTKFSLITLFSYNVVLTFVLYLFYILLGKKRGVDIVLASLFFLLVSLTSYPLLNGEVAPDRANGVIKQFIVKVPAYWDELNSYTKRNPRIGRTLTLPKNGYYGVSYIWEKGFNGRASDIFYTGALGFFNRFDTANEGDLLFRDLYDFIAAYNLEGDPSAMTGFVNLARVLNVNYLLQQNDFDWRQLNFGTPAPAEWSIAAMTQFLENTSDYIVLEKNFGRFTDDYLKKISFITGGKNINIIQGDPTYEEYASELVGREALALYALKPEYKTFRIYTPDVITITPSKEDMLQQLRDANYLAKAPLFVDSIDLSPAITFRPSVTYQRINPAKYKVILAGQRSDTTVLVFSDSYDDNWQLASSCNLLGCEFIEAAHFMANFYANGWLLESDVPDEFFIVYKAQFRLVKSVLVSAITLLGLAGTYIWFSKRYKHV